MSGKKHALSLAFLVLLIVCTFWFLLKDIGLQGLMHALRQANGWFLLAGLGMLLLFFLCEGEVVRTITGSLGYRTTLRRGFVYACVDFYFSAITPSATGGQPVCLYYMSKDKIPVPVSGLAMLLQTVVYKIVLLLLGIWVLLAKHHWFKAGHWGVKLLFIAGFVINVIVIIVCLMAMFSRRAIRKMATWVIRLAGRIRLIKKPDEVIQKLLRALEDYAKGAEYIRTHLMLSLRVLLITAVQRLAMFSISYFVYRAMGLMQYSLMDMVALQTLIAMAIDSLPLPGGMGASEGVFTMLYRTVYGVRMLVPALILTRGINYYCGLLISSGSVIYNQSRLVRKEKKQQKVKEE